MAENFSWRSGNASRRNPLDGVGGYWGRGQGMISEFGKRDRCQSVLPALDPGRWAFRVPGLGGENCEVIGGRFAPAGNPGGSGTGPEQALEAIHPIPRAQRERRSSFELPCARRSGPAEPSPERGHLPTIPDIRTFRHHPRIQNREPFPAPISCPRFPPRGCGPGARHAVSQVWFQSGPD